MLWEDLSAFGVPKSRVSPATFLDWRRRMRVFERIAAYAAPRSMDLSGGGPPEEVFGLSVTASLFPALGYRHCWAALFQTAKKGQKPKSWF